MRALSWICCSLAVLFTILSVGSTSQAGVLLVAGSPEYDQETDTGLLDGSILVVPGSGVNNSGTAVGYAEKYEIGGSLGTRAVRWDGSGTAAELGCLGSYGGYTQACAYAVNDAGMAVGFVHKYEGGSLKGTRAVCWDGSGTAAAELGSLGTYSSGFALAYAHAVNDAGTIVGYSRWYVDDNDKGYRAVRWNPSSTIAVKLGSLGADSSGYATSRAYAVNDVGTIVGYSSKYVNYDDKGTRAVRWTPSSIAPAELGDLGTDSSGKTEADAYAVNDYDTAVGFAQKYVNGNYVGTRAVRWDGSGTVATELGNIGTNSNGSTTAYAYAVNDAGTAVGYAYKYESGLGKGERAVRWDGSGTSATELGNLGTSSSGSTTSFAYAVNNAGTAVGRAQKYENGHNLGSHAVIWLPDASAIDMNDLGVAPVSGGGTWMLGVAYALSSDGWVAGKGFYDPDGAGPLERYLRLWVTQVGLGGSWTNAGGGTWGRGFNWSTGTPAMQVGEAAFDLDETYTVDLDRDELTKTMAVNAGTVTIYFNGHCLATQSGLNIADGATFHADGTIGGDMFNAGALQFDIAGDASYDRIDLSGSFNAGGTIVVVLDGYDPVAGDLFDLMDFGGFVDDGYAFDLSSAALSPGLVWDTTSFAATGSIGVVYVPEPCSLVILGIGVICLLAYGKKCGRLRILRR